MQHPVKILCYGDSNTWGYVPDGAVEDQRFPPEIRWTGILQTLLGVGVQVIEEGLNSRTTDLDYPDVPGKNGLAAMPETLARHSPIDVLVLMLGSNDLKKEFNRSPAEIASGLERVILCARARSVEQMVLMAPPVPSEAHVYDSFQYAGLENKARGLAPLYQGLARKQGLDFLDLSQEITSSSIDGVHLEVDQHEKLARLLAPMLKAKIEKK